MPGSVNYGWQVPIEDLQRGDLVMYQAPEQHPDCLAVGDGLFLVREYLVQAKLDESDVLETDEDTTVIEE